MLRRNLIALAAVACASAALGGCGGSNYDPPETPTSEEARAALVTALDAWKSGEAVDALAKREPAVHVSDHDWSSSTVLKDYQFSGEPEIHGNKIRMEVTLLLQRAGQSARRTPAVYLVSTQPVISVVRSDIAE